MKGLIRSKLTLTLIALVVLAVVATPMVLTLTRAHAATPQFAATGNLDCNGFSKIQQPIRAHDSCTDFKGYDGGRGIDNGHYVGHDEPTVQFVSNVGGSGNNTQ